MPATEKEKMLAGELYRASDPELVRERAFARDLLRRYNATSEADPDDRQELLERLFGRVGADVWVEPPFYCDYGANIVLGDRVYLNFGCVVLDCASVEFGDDVLFGPAVQVYPATHPIDPEERRSGLEYARPIRIGANAWIGGGAIIGPGVTIGENAVIGAGSVVVKDIPAGVVAVGNPCRVLRQL